MTNTTAYRKINFTAPKRMEPDYFSHIREYETEMIAGLEQLKDAGAYWRL